jgi:hypothetical protein
MLVVVDGKEITMPTDFTFTLPNQPGTGARVLDALGHAGVNIIGACAVSQDGDSTVHLAVDDAEEARTALQAAGVQISSEREVAITAVEDRPGAGARLLRRLGDAGINVDFLYLASNNRLVLGVADVNKALGVL